MDVVWMMDYEWIDDGGMGGGVDGYVDGWLMGRHVVGLMNG